MKIAIMGATGHISKCTLWALTKENKHEIYLFSRNITKLENLIKQFPNADYKLMEGYNFFFEHEYDIIFNGTGFWDTPGCETSDIFELTEKYDNMILDYQKDNPNSKSIHVSSGAAYASNYDKPADDNTLSQLNINSLNVGDYYSIAKINSEAKHRAHHKLNIVDLRLFGFFSRFMSLEYRYLLSAMINSVKENKSFTCVGENFWRDYIHMNDFKVLINKLCQSESMNLAIDVSSTKPISRDEIISIFKQEYNLKVVNRFDETAISKTGNKTEYYSLRPNKIYHPIYSSEEALRNELKFFL